MLRIAYLVLLILVCMAAGIVTLLAMGYNTVTPAMLFRELILSLVVVHFVEKVTSKI